MADNRDEIEFTLTGLAAVLKGFKQVQDAAAATGKAVEASTGKKAGGGARAAKSPFVNGPHQRLTSYRDQYTRALKDGNKDAEKDIKVAIDRTEKQLNRLKQPTFAKKLESFVRSSRIGAGGSLMPLVGQGMDLLGEVGGPVMAFTTAILDAGKALKAFTDNAQGSVSAFGSNQLSMASTGIETGQIKSLASFLNIDPSQLAAEAAGVGKAASTPGWGMISGKAAGLSPLPAPYAHLDQGADLLQVINAIRNSPSDASATLMARNLGADNLLPVRKMSGSAYQTMMAQGSKDSSIFGGDALKTAADYAASQANLTSATDRLRVSVDKAAAPWLTRMQNDVAKGLDKNSSDIDKKGFWTWFTGELGKANPRSGLPPMTAASLGDTPVVSALKDKADSLTAASINKDAPSGKSAEAEYKQAMRDLIVALNKNTQQMPGNYGKVTRGEAFREGQTGLSLQKALAAREYFALGSF